MGSFLPGGSRPRETMNIAPDDEPEGPLQLHVPTALGCLALQTLFIGMCLYHNAAIHDFGGMLSTISFSSIFLATQALIGVIVCSRSLRWTGTVGGTLSEARIPLVLALSCVAAIGVLIRSPMLADRLLSYSNPVSLSADGTELRLNGSIPVNLRADIESLCANGACVAARTLVLSSEGGNFDGAVDGLESLKSVGVRQAIVDGVCESACVALWAGFDQARVPPGSVLGVQGVYDPLTGQATPDSVPKTRRLIRLLLDRGFPRPVVEAATAYPSNRFYYLTGAEIDTFRNASGDR